MLYELVSTCREPMLRHMREIDPKGYGLPRHIDRELEAYLRCGILAYGFIRSADLEHALINTRPHIHRRSSDRPYNVGAAWIY